MTGVKVMAFPQIGLAGVESVENAVGDVEQPGAKGEEQRREDGQVQMHGDEKNHAQRAATVGASRLRRCHHSARL